MPDMSPSVHLSVGTPVVGTSPTPLVSMLLALLVLLVGGVGGRPPECKWTLGSSGVTAGGGGEQIHTTCHIRTLNRDLLTEDSAGLDSNSTSLSDLALAPHVTLLTLHCARQVVFQSQIIAGMFSIFPRLENLKILSCKVTELPSHALVGLPHLRRLTLRAHHEDWRGAALTLHPNALLDLNRLEALDLAHNALWSLPSAILCQLPSLTSLNLTHNYLHHLPELGLGTLEKQEEGGTNSPPECSLPLQHLDLSHNQVSEVPDRAFSKAEELQRLSLHHNRLAHLADWAFSGLGALKQLELSHNRLVAVPQPAFTDLRQLQELSLSNNSLGVLPPSAFKNLGQLLILDLSHNQLSLGTNNVEPFTGLIRLVVLDLSYNQLLHLGPNTFRDLYSLQVLQLNHNKLTHLSDATFLGLANLDTLELSHNQLATLSGKALQGLAVLTHLSLDHNQLQTIHETALDNCSSLHYLSLSHNKLLTLPSAVEHAPLLWKLDFNHNEISSIDEGVLQGLLQLQELTVSHNFLSNLSRSSFVQVPSLKYLDLSHNLLTGVEHGTFEATPKLIGLNLHHNSLGDINSLVTHLQNLTWLNVSHNAITWFDYALVSRNLEWLDISHNLLTKLENYYEVQKTLGLSILYATHNNISDINAAAVPDGIKELYLQHNDISYVAFNTFLDKTKVSIINLQYNSLSILEEAALRLSPRQTPPPILLLSHNPIQCDCASDWLLRAAGAGLGKSLAGSGSTLPQLGDVGSVKCQLPGLWEDAIVPLIDIQPQQFLCTYRRHCFTLCHCCDFDACDCEQTCPRNCTCYHDHTWTHNVVDCGGGWEHMPSGVPMDVTEAFMDGNSMGALSSHALIGRKNLRVLHLNRSAITLIQNRTFNGLKNLQVLRLDHNKLEAIHGYEFTDLHNLRELYLNSNCLKHLSNISFSPLRAIELLQLDNNLLTTFPVWNLALNPFLLEVSLFENPWSCECSYLANLHAWLEANRIKATNASFIKCWHNSTGTQGPPVLSDTPVSCDHYLPSTRINTLIIQDYFMLLLISSILLLLLLAAAVLVVAYRRRLKHWAIRRYGKRLFEKSSAYVEDREKLFDAYVGHSAKDSTWVCGLMAAELEASGYRLCVVHRDCTAPSAPVSGQAIAESISCSRRVVLVLSRGLVDAEWCRYDFKSVHVDSLQGLRRRKILVVKLEDIPKSELDPELASIIRSAGTILHPQDPRFWEKLRRAMPSLRPRLRPELTAALAGKAVSRPLVAADVKNGPCSWSLPENKVLGHAPSKSLTVNPYWETAIVSQAPSEATWRSPGLLPDLGAPPWLHNCTSKPSPSPGGNEARDRSSPQDTSSVPDHTYMSVSECGDVTDALVVHSAPAMTSEGALLNGRERGTVERRTEEAVSGRVSHALPTAPPPFRRDGPDYLTHSWIFHPPSTEPPPPPGQTYFV